VVVATVREAESADACEIARVHIASWQVAYRGTVPDAILDGLDLGERAKQWAHNLANPHGNVRVATCNERICGFCSYGQARDDDLADDVGEITAIYAAPESWGSGVGRALMEAALGALAGRGFGAVTLWVLEQNPRARRFYQLAGFQPDGKRALIFGEHKIPEMRYRRAL
jgi:ribosomal protein S18 acetylase RimI-like enzyme